MSSLKNLFEIAAFANGAMRKNLEQSDSADGSERVDTLELTDPVLDSILEDTSILPPEGETNT